uniref:Uncharacterized protein n=1 Tax=Arundo donax TaxID=35708 RepID=A0A0A9ECQ9_ARUDO
MRNGDSRLLQPVRNRSQLSHSCWSLSPSRACSCSKDLPLLPAAAPHASALPTPPLEP